MPSLPPPAAVPVPASPAGRAAVRRLAGLAGLAALLGLSVSLHAQIGVDLKADRTRYLQFEPISVTVTLRNYTGNSLVFGDDPQTQGGLRFVVETANGLPARQLDKTADPAAGLTLGAGETKTLTLALNTVYNMQKETTYTVFAQVSHPRLASDFRSTPIIVEVQAGVVLWSRDIGLPSAAQGDRIRSRTVSLLVFHEGRRDVYCLRVEDSQLVYAVIRLGPRISGTTPECDVDAVSSVHILLVQQPRLYAYRVYDCNGELRQERFYLVDNAPPRLERDQDMGRITVVGGRVAVPGVDFQLLGTGGRQAPGEAEPEAAPPAGTEAAPASPPDGAAPRPAARTAAGEGK